MTWVVVGIVTLAIIGFFVYLFVIRWWRMARHGRLEIPCDRVIELPAGEHTVYYEDATRWRYSETPKVADGFSLLISEAESGRRVDLAGPRSRTATKTGGKNRIPYALLSLSGPGSYRVIAQVNAGVESPHLTIG